MPATYILICEYFNFATHTKTKQDKIWIEMFVVLRKELNCFEYELSNSIK